MLAGAPGMGVGNVSVAPAARLPAAPGTTAANRMEAVVPAPLETVVVVA